MLGSNTELNPQQILAF